MTPEKVEKNRDLNTLADQLEYLRALQNEAADPSSHGRWSQKAARTNVGADLVSASSEWARQTLRGRERYYFEHFTSETSPEQRRKILNHASPELARALAGQWLGAEIAGGAGERVNEVNGVSGIMAEVVIGRGIRGLQPSPDIIGLRWL